MLKKEFKEIYEKIESLMSQALKNSAHPYRTFSLASIDEKMPSLRTVVLRDFSLEENHFDCHSDLRSPKIKELNKNKLYDKIWQAYAALLPVKTVGVMGDNRTYEYMCLLRAITSEDGMTADTFYFKKEFMQIVSNKIINNIKGINCLTPNGAFYVFPSCKGLLNKKTKLKTDTEFVQKLLEQCNVAVVQGSAFGLDGYFRISYATSMQNLKKAMDRIKSFCESLS